MKMIDPTIESATTEEFRELVLDSYPGLRRQSRYRKLAAYLLFGTHCDEETGDLIVPARLLAAIEKKTSQIKNHNYTAESFLQGFQTDVMTPETFRWSSWRYVDRIARTVEVDWTNEIKAALALELPRTLSERRMIFHSGKICSEANRREIHQQIKNDARRQVLAHAPAAQPLLNYLDQLSPTIFRRRMNRNLPVVRAVLADKFYSRQITQDQYQRELKILKFIEEYPKPVYTVSPRGRTDRIFPVGGSYLGLSKAYRIILLAGWYDCDLRSSQLAIAAGLWKIKLVQEFIDDGENIWDSLYKHLGIDLRMKNTDRETYDDIKGQLKEGLYSCLYGMHENGIGYRLRRCRPLIERVPDAVERFFKHPVIAALLEVRGQVMADIIQKGYGVTCFGRRIKLSPEVEPASIMAQIAQAAELRLLLPVIDVARDSEREIQIVLWCHDGFVLSVAHLERLALWMKRLESVVESAGRNLGIQAKLEYSLLGESGSDRLLKAA